MIQEIDIQINNGLSESINATINFSKKLFSINNIKYSVNDTFLDNLLDTIYLWQNEYGRDDNIDSEEFTVNVKTDSGIETFHGKGIFPQNYYYFKELLGDFNG